MQAGSFGDGAGVAVVAGTCANFLYALLDVGCIGEAIAGEVDLIDVEGSLFDEWPERFASAFFFAGSNRYWGTVAEPTVAFDILRMEGFFEPFDIELRESMGATQCGGGHPRRSQHRLAEWRRQGPRERPQPNRGLLVQIHPSAPSRT